MSWWMRRRGRRSAARERSTSASVSRKLPPTIQNTSTSPRALCSTISAAVHPGVCGTGNPQTSDQRAAVFASTFGMHPTSAPPCTPECPRIGTSPRFGRPGSPRARPTFTSALIVSTPFTCCVSPIDHTKTVLGLSISSCANSSIRSRGMPLAASIPVPVLGHGNSARQIKVGRPVAHERLVNAPAFDERAEHAQQERGDHRRCGRRTSDPPVGSRTLRFARSTESSNARSQARGTD